MSAQPTIRQGRIAVMNALAELGLRPEYLSDALLAGELARDSCTANDPRSAGGFFAWSRSVRSLREILAHLGWFRDDDAISTVVSPDGSIAIDVVTGNDDTGQTHAGATPNTKYPKGPATERAVNSNQHSLLDLLEWEEGAVEQTAGATRQTWMLLRKRVGDDLLLAELSLPESMTEQGYVERWSVRIILDIDIGPALAVQEGNSSGEPPIDVPVRRRT